MKKPLAILLTFCALAAAAQEYITPVKNDLMPPTPQSWKPVEYQMPQPSMLTGAVDLSIPIYTITAGDYSLPIYMQYHSNGIKVTDDPLPYGYGWTLMPALRATRTIMGRPDEKFDFMLAPTTPMECLQCIGNIGAVGSINERYDSQHDLMTFSLPGKTITAVLDCTGATPNFVSAMADEYKISADENLDEITVIDPYGVKYIYGGVGEFQPTDDYVTGGQRTAWSLTKIVVNNSDTITLDWELRVSNFANPTLYGGFSFMDRWTPWKWGDGQGNGLMDFEVDDGESANFSPYGFCDNMMSLHSISFPGGSVTINRGVKFVESIIVKAGDDTVKSATFGYDNTYYLLTLLTLSDEGQYKFDYAQKVGFSGNSGQDWWGFYNGTSPASHTPRIKLKQYANALDDTGSYITRGVADRSPNAEAMKANLITKVIYPTGGSTQFKYEPHRFALARDEYGEDEIDPAFNTYLNMGGGVRVSEITTTSTPDVSDTMTVSYSYPDAVVRAVPTISTFIDITKWCKGLKDIPNSSNDYDILRSVHINMNSSYMRYDIGETELWYETVTATYPEGKIEYRHGDVLPYHNMVSRDFGYRAPSGLYRVCSPGLQLIEKNIYKRSGSSYIKVESESFVIESSIPDFLSI